MAEWAVRYRSASIALACRAFSISETCYRYQPKLSDENELIADWLVALTNAKKTWGFGLCFLHLRNVKGFKWNHKRVYRIYRELELNGEPSGFMGMRPCRSALCRWRCLKRRTRFGPWTSWPTSWRMVVRSGH